MAEASRAGVFASRDPLTAAAIWEAAGIAPSRSEACRMLILVHLARPLDAAGWHAVAELVGAALEADEETLPEAAEDRTLTLNLRTEIDVTKAVVRMGGAEIGVVDLGALAEAGVAEPEPMGGGVAAEPEAWMFAEQLEVELPSWPVDEAPEPCAAAVDLAPEEEGQDDGEDAWWTPARDLLLVETLASGKKIANAALTLDRPREDCLARYRQLLPKVTLVEQQSLIKRLRAEVAEG